MEENILIIANMALVAFCFALIVYISIMTYQLSSINEEMNKEIAKIDKACPKCPDCKLECPKNPSCPKCPDCPKCPICQECSDFEGLDKIAPLKQNDKKDNKNIKESSTKKCPTCPSCPGCPGCPSCPKCPDSPTVDDIVTGIYPGRNPKEGDGQYFEVDPSNTHSGLSQSNFYEQEYKFPMDNILQPDNSTLASYNIHGSKQMKNHIENNVMNTSVSQDLINTDKPILDKLSSDKPIIGTGPYQNILS